jgi:uncharacterized protein (TIGR02246 family)
MLKSICVFAGSSSGAHPQYVQAARELGREIAARNYRLVYGGAAVGLMGALADAILEAAGNVIGVMPELVQPLDSRSRATFTQPTSGRWMTSAKHIPGGGRPNVEIDAKERKASTQRVLSIFRPRRKTMKTCLLGVLAGLTICSIWPTFAQQEDLPIARQGNLLGDPNALGEFGALSIKMDEALNNNDAGALAALFTEDAVLVAWDGMFFGRQAIEKRYAEMFQRLPIATFAGQRSALNAIDNAVWAVGEWWSTVQSQAGPKFERGYWSAIYVREGDAWKIRQFTISDAPHLSVSVRSSIHASFLL